MTEHILKFRAKDAQPTGKMPAGYAMIPRQALRDEGLSDGSKVLLAAIISLCFGDARVIKATVQEIGEQAGMSAKKVRYYLPHLIKAGLIVRRKDPDRSWGPWLTCLDCDPRGFKLSNDPANWRTRKCTTRPKHPYPISGGGIPETGGGPYPKRGDPLIQPSLNLSLEGEGESRARDPEGTSPAPARQTPKPRQEPVARPAPAPAPEPTSAPPWPLPGPLAPMSPPDELTTGRTAEEHALFLEAWHDLAAHEPTAFIARDLAMAADTPGVRCLPAWKLWVGTRIVMRPDKGTSYNTFLKSARIATEEEYHRLRAEEAAGAAAARGEPPPGATPTLQKPRASQLIDAYAEYFHAQGADIQWPSGPGLGMPAGPAVDRAIRHVPPGEAPADGLADPGGR